LTTQKSPAAPPGLAGDKANHRQNQSHTIGRRAWAFTRELLIVVVGAVVVSSLLRAFVGQMFIIPSQSMENTLLVGDRVVVQKLTDFKRGDVVVFSDPGGWLEAVPAQDPPPWDKVLEFIGLPTRSTPGHLIKRVIGMPGDKVVCCTSKGRITVNGQALDESSYLYTDPDDDQINPSDVRFEVVVPKDRIFVMGDHRDLSADSRCHLSDLSTSQGKGQVAFVPTDLVVGPAFAIAAPFDRAGRLRQPATFEKVPAPRDPAPERAVIKPAGVSC
jgi:signal peptidase I